MQKHLLSSTLQTNTSTSARSRHGHTSPTNISTTPALTLVPTPSPSPFSNMNDIGFTLADPKSMDITLGSKAPQSLSSSSHNYVEYVESQSGRAKIGRHLGEQNNVLQAPVHVQSSLEQMVTLSSDLSYSSQEPVQSVSAGQSDVKLLLVESSSTSIPNSIAYLAPVAPQPISLIHQPSTETVSVSNSGLEQVQFPIPHTSKAITTNFIHPNKKKRLLTFLTEQENSICSVNDNNQIILTPAPQKSEQILFDSSKPDQILINSAKTESLNPPPTPTLFLQPCVNTISAPQPMENVKQETTLIINPPPAPKNEATLIINPPPAPKNEATLIINPPPAPKNESTLIINPEGTSATLITPVVSANGNLPLLTPCITPSIIGHVSMSSSPAATNYTLVQSAPSVDIVSMNFPPKQPAPSNNNFTPQTEKSNFDQFTEQVTCYKCRICGYLAVNKTKLNNHLLDDHDDVIVVEDTTLESTWLAAAVKHGIKLNCPFCSNTFQSGRSFQVHVAEDHDRTDDQAKEHLDQKNKERKEKAQKLVKEEKQRAREARKRRRQLSYEAYIDNNNELCVRQPKTVTNIQTTATPATTGIATNIVVNLAAEYPKFETKSSKLTPVNLPNQDRKNNTNKMISEYKCDSVKKLRNIAPAVRPAEKTKVKCTNGDCSVVLESGEKMRLHLDSHHGTSFLCPLGCKEEAGSWSQMRLHLWHGHKYDLDLITCPHEDCGYKTTSSVKLDKHSGKHSEDKPWLCPLCGQAFKLARQLRVHTSSVHAKLSKASISSLSCQICKASFTSAKHLRQHVDSVHYKKKNFLCSFCGYSASSKSALKLHTRRHTGDKPFSCDECSFTSSDHNSYRRHRMRHSGVRPYNCPYCNYSSIQSTTYKVHLKTKHSVDDVSSILFQCDKCVFKTLKENIYLAHLAEHKNSQ